MIQNWRQPGTLNKLIVCPGCLGGLIGARVHTHDCWRIRMDWGTGKFGTAELLARRLDLMHPAWFVA